MTINEVTPQTVATAFAGWAAATALLVVGLNKLIDLLNKK